MKAIFSIALTALIFTHLQACTRVVYLGEDERILTARSMDWKVDIGTNLWILPRGIERSGGGGENSITWKAKYGSVVATAYDIASADGVNEKGLFANLLWLVESKYPQNDGQKSALATSLWAQYVLDNFATVTEAVDALRKEEFIVVTDLMPGFVDKMATVHLSISDSSGDSAIFEYVDGKLTIHHGKEYQIMTNSPIFEQQLAISSYWGDIDGTVMLPGTNKASDRFVRAKYYINAIEQTKDQTLATAGVFSVIRNVSVPFGITTPDQPNISSTRWRTVVDHKSLIYYFESAMSPNIFWVDLNNVDFSHNAKVKKLELGKNQSIIYSGEVSKKFKVRKPFAFQELAH